jgi:crossover junction endodeoxyribonuclease RuvC
MSMLYIGVDPGKTGALAMIGNGKVIYTTVMMLMGKDIDWTEMAHWIKLRLRYPDGIHPSVVACIEKVHAMPGQGVTSMFNFGFVTGGIHGVLGALDIPRYLVTPQAWKKEILAGTPRDKEAAIDYVTRVYPGVSLLPTPRSTKPHSGIADAICIARYASLHF